MRREDVSYFDRKSEFGILQRRVPHWDQSGVFAFVTFRLIDSLPQQLLRQLNRERMALLTAAGINPTVPNIRDAINRLRPRDASILRWKLFLAWDDKLDSHCGECVLRNSGASKIVSDGLLKFDGDRYVMAAFVVMPNHVHLLAAFEKEGQVTKQGADWRRYFGRNINLLLGREDHLWQEDQFDHLVRSEASFDRIRRYIIENPIKGRLAAGDYRLFVSPEF